MLRGGRRALWIAAAFLAISTATRIGLALFGDGGFSLPEWIRLLGVGLVFDVVVLAWVLLPWVLYDALLPAFATEKRLGRGEALWATLWGTAYLGFFLADGTEVGMLASPDGLDDDSRRVLMAELERSYFLPVITAVRKIGEEFGVVHAEVETTSGPREIEIRGIRSSIRVLSRQRALVEDASGNRYELRDYHRLEKLTREILGL